MTSMDEVAPRFSPDNSDVARRRRMDVAHDHALAWVNSSTSVIGNVVQVDFEPPDEPEPLAA